MPSIYERYPGNPSLLRRKFKKSREIAEDCGRFADFHENYVRNMEMYGLYLKKLLK